MPKTVSASYTDYYGLYEHPYNSTYRFTPIADGGTYHRQENFYISGYTRAIFSERLGYPPIEGEDWTFKIKDPNNNNQEISYITYYYENQCVYVKSNEWGPFKLTCVDPSRDSVFYFLGTFGVGCVPTQPYRFGFNHSSNTMPDITYNPTEFEPGEAVFNPVGTVTPYLPASHGNGNVAPEITEGTAVIRLTVYDNYGCGVTVPNAAVDLKNTIKPGSGSHAHFILDTEPGTGEYIESSPLWNIIDGKIRITVNADEFGVVNAKYKADLYGVDETITAKTHGIEPYSGGVRKEYKATENLRIAVPSLIPLDTSGATYTLYGSMSPNTGDQQHNDGHSARRSHYVTPSTRANIQELNDLYVAETLLPDLCLNDASLRYGGYFDNGKGGRAVKGDSVSIENNKAHDSHRRGIDIDVNVLGFGCPDNLNDPYIDLNGNPVYKNGVLQKKRKILDEIATNKLDAFKAREASIHYRFFD